MIMLLLRGEQMSIFDSGILQFKYRDSYQNI